MMVDWPNVWGVVQVQGGDSERLGRANYHPFYITTSRTGGFARKLDVEKGEADLPFRGIVSRNFLESCH